MFKNLTPAVLISFLGLIVSTIVLIFGNNILQRFQRAELVYISKEVELKFPGNLKISRVSSFKDSMPNLYREVSIKNIGGSPSIMLKVAIELDGSILESQISCIENIRNVEINGSHVEITLDRLVKNAEILCKFWLVQKPGAFSVTCIDNEGINNVKAYIGNDSISWYQILALLSILGILSFLLHLYYIKPLKSRNSSLREQNLELQEQNNFLMVEINELKPKTEEIDVPKDIIKELKSIIEKHGNDPN